MQRHAGDIPRELDRDCYNPMDGHIIEICDKLAAYIEASVFISTGIRSPALEEGKCHLYNRFRQVRINGLSLGYLFEYFR